MLHPKKKQYSHIEHPTWSQQSIATHRISQNSKRESELEIIFHGRQGRNPPQYWSSIKRFTSYQSRDVIGRRSQIGSTIHQCKNSSTNSNNTRWDGTCPTKNTNANRQFQSTWCDQQYNHAQSNQINEHLFPLATMTEYPGPISILLATRPNQSGRLLEQTSPHSTSHQLPQRNTHIKEIYGCTATRKRINKSNK